MNLHEKQETDSKLLAFPLASSLQTRDIIQYGTTFVVYLL